MLFISAQTSPTREGQSQPRVKVSMMQTVTDITTAPTSQSFRITKVGKEKLHTKMGTFLQQS
jgi:hypothetical protein